MRFDMPESLDIGYKFFGGKFTFKDLAYRSVGLIPAIPVAMLMFVATGNGLWTGIVAGLLVFAGFFIGGWKVFGGQMRLLEAMVHEPKLKAKKKIVLYNMRTDSIPKDIETEDTEVKN